MFSSLKVRDFRIYWFGMLVSLIGTWLQGMAQSWLVFELTNSAFLLGMVGFLNSLPMFGLSLLGGVVADRVNKKSVLLFTQSAFMALAFILAILTQLKLITAPEVMFMAVLNGVVMAFDAPARHAIVVELVGRERLLNAIALNSAAFNSSRIIGPALAGILVAVIGMSGCFYINGLSFLAVIAALLMIKVHPSHHKEARGLFIRDLVEGLNFIRKSRIIMILVSIVGITSLFGISYVILMPIFARDILQVGLRGLGMLMSAAGCGALIAALSLAALGDFKPKGKFLLASCMIFSLGLMLFSLSKVYVLSLALLVVVGWGSVMAISLINTLLQQIVPDHFRGRLMSVFMFTFAGVLPFGNLIAGSLTQAWGAPRTVFAGAALCGAFFIAINFLYPNIRKL
jgi:MFS family permease